MRPLALESIDNVEGGDSLALGVLSVGDGIADDVLEEDLEDRAGLLVDEARDTLDTSTTGETTDGGLGDTLDVVTKNLAMALGTTLSKTFSSFAAARHGLMWGESGWGLLGESGRMYFADGNTKGVRERGENKCAGSQGRRTF